MSLKDVLWYAAIVTASLYLVFRVLWRALLKISTEKRTVNNEIPLLGKARADGKKVRGTAVIAGGSIAGLTAASVCSAFFDRVVVIEPDSLDDSAKRTRIGQLHQIHAIKPVTLQILRALFPQTDEEILALDGRILDGDNKTQWGPVNVRFPPNIIPQFFCLTRIALETLLRRLVSTIPNLTIIQGSVVSVTPSASGDRIDSVTVRADSAGSSAARENNTMAGRILGARTKDTIVIPTAFLADCTGPVSAGVKWLEKCGWNGHERISYDPKVAYATATIPIPARVREKLPLFDHSDYPGGYERFGFGKVLFPLSSQYDRAIYFTRVENDRLTLCLNGWDLPVTEFPTTLDGFIEQFDTCYRRATWGGEPQPWVMDTLRMISRALDEDGYKSKFINFKMGPCFVQSYKPENMPSNYAALGDAIVRVDPTFGQGIHKAMMDCASLSGTLHAAELVQSKDGGYELPKDFAATALKRQLGRSLPMWESTRALDYARPNTIPCPGETLDHNKFLRNYFEAFFTLAGKDKWAAATLVSALQTIVPSIVVMHPRYFFRVLWIMHTHRPPVKN